MRFPFKAYAEMVAQEEKAVPHQAAKKSAGEKAKVSESAIEDDKVDDEIDDPEQDVEDDSGSGDDDLVD